MHTNTPKINITKPKISETFPEMILWLYVMFFFWLFVTPLTEGYLEALSA